MLETSHQPLARFMQGLQQSYTQYFNRVHEKVGHLFQGRYKAIVCEKDEYLLTLIRYIHLNPVRARLAKEVEEYKWSGHRTYISGRASEVVDPSKVLELFGGRARYQKFVLDGMQDGHRDEYYEVEDQRFLGTEGFGEKLRREIEEDSPRTPTKPLTQVVKRLASEIKVDVALLRSPDRGRFVSKVRTAIGYALVRKLGFRVREVAVFLGRDPTTLSVLIGRLMNRMESDEEIAKMVDRLSRIV